MRVKRMDVKLDHQEEQLCILRQILVELQRINANLEANPNRTATIESKLPDSIDNEELEEYE